jgi:hypothetical protein
MAVVFYTSCLGVGKTLFSLMFFINKLECLSLSTIFSLSLLFSSLHIDKFRCMTLIRMARCRIECQCLFLEVLLHFCTFLLKVFLPSVILLNVVSPTWVGSSLMLD